MVEHSLATRQRTSVRDELARVYAEAASADEWLAGATEVKGSWWPRWAEWLKSFGGGETPARGRLGSKAYPAGEPAPGRYVKEKAA